MAKTTEKQVTKVPEKQARPVLVRYAPEPKGPWCGAIVRQWNADGTLSLCLFPHGINSLAFADAVPHKADPRAVDEGRGRSDVWDYAEDAEELRSKIVELRSQIDELTNLVTK